jgi:hypothetical protein
MALFLTIFFWRPGTAKNKPKTAENSLFFGGKGLIFGDFWLPKMTVALVVGRLYPLYRPTTY